MKDWTRGLPTHNDLVTLARLAGSAILDVYGTDFAVDIKSDRSPLTQADLAAHRVIVDGLADMTPDIPVFSEESVPPPFEERRGWQRYWLVDPLDGTKEFVSRNGEFTVNIALIVEGRPLLGVVAVPVRDQVYLGDASAGHAVRIDAEREEVILEGRPMDRSRVCTVVASRSHGGERLEAFVGALDSRFPGIERRPVGSSLKLCILAEGGADLYPRLGPTSEWDIAAAHAVLAAAGGDVWAVDGSEIGYNKGDSVLNPEFFAVADREFPWRGTLPDVPE